jgi:hypothetical protein
MRRKLYCARPGQPCGRIKKKLMEAKQTDTLSAEEVVDRLAMLNLREDLAKAEVWRKMAEQAETWGYPEVAADLKAHADTLEQ